jgi:hypothetical protein
MVPYHSFRRPMLVAIDVSLGPGAGLCSLETRQEIVLDALAAALFSVSDEASHAWMIQAIERAETPCYRLQPVASAAVPAEDVWELALALGRQAQIQVAIPLFSNAPDVDDGALDYGDRA